MMESLEQRRLLSFAVSAGVLTVTGTANPDKINLSKDGTNIVILQNGVKSTTPAADVTKIIVNALGGNDAVSIAADPLHGLKLPSTLNGGDGNDNLMGGAANDVLNGGNNNDILIGGPGADVFNGGAGNDTADYHAARSNLIITLDNVANDGAPALVATATAPARPAENDNVKGDVENVMGGIGNDKITGNAANNRLVGGPGNDSLTGNDGNDTLDGGPGIDTLIGNNGNDFFISKDDKKDSVNGGDGEDSAANDSLDILASIEKPNQQLPQQPPPPPQPPAPPPPPPATT